MCVSAYVFHADGRRSRVSGIGDLADALGIGLRAIPMQRGMAFARRRNECLCNVDMPRLAKSRGMTCEAPEYDDTDHFDGWALRETRNAE